MKNLVNYAIKYAKAGFSVIPCIKKKPLIKFADKPPLTEYEIKKIWKKYPYANIAVKTDSFFVVDIDRHEGGEDGVAELQKLPNYKKWLFNTAYQQTAHNGFQFFFKKPEGKIISQNIGMLPGVDIKGHRNNYVIVAPSVIDGRKYKWLKNDYWSEPSKDFLEFILKTKTTNKKLADYLKEPEKKDTNLFSIIAYGFGDEGYRNDCLARFCGSLLNRDVDPNTLFRIALIANNNTSEPLSEREVERTVQSIIDKDLRRMKEHEKGRRFYGN